MGKLVRCSAALSFHDHCLAAPGLSCETRSPSVSDKLKEGQPFLARGLVAGREPVMKTFGLAVLAAIGGYVIGLFGGRFFIEIFSTNRHDKSLEAAMTGAFVLGP